MSKNNLFNILVRTSNRPNYFKDCIKSINEQVYKNHNIIVSVDNDFTEDYVKKLNLKSIYVNTKLKKNRIYKPYNLYINEMYKYIKEGYCLILDDDDQFTNYYSLELLSSKINFYDKPEDNLYIFQTQLSKDFIVPRDFSEKQVLYPGNIASCGFCFHSKWLFAAQWDEFKVADFRVAHKLKLVTKKMILIDKIFTRRQNLGIPGKGHQKDKNY
tara:strand:+ start:198 stop:839 length:642 start_codon:yes stop_codon:yes gene_type:complete